MGGRVGLWALALPLPSGPRPWAGKASYRPVSSIVHNYDDDDHSIRYCVKFSLATKTMDLKYSHPTLKKENYVKCGGVNSLRLLW